MLFLFFWLREGHNNSARYSNISTFTKMDLDPQDTFTRILKDGEERLSVRCAERDNGIMSSILLDCFFPNGKLGWFFQ